MLPYKYKPDSNGKSFFIMNKQCRRNRFISYYVRYDVAPDVAVLFTLLYGL